MCTQATIDSFTNELRIKYKNVLTTLKMEKSDDHIRLVEILIKKSQRNKGYGHAVMHSITEFSNNVQLPIVLKASSMFGSDLQRLFMFYRKNGFFNIEDDQMKYNPTKLN